MRKTDQKSNRDRVDLEDKMRGWTFPRALRVKSYNKNKKTLQLLNGRFVC